MIPRTPAETLIANTIARALSGQLTVAPFDLMRLATAAREVEPARVAPLALALWLREDPRAQDIIRWLSGRTAHPSDRQS